MNVLKWFYFLLSLILFCLPLSFHASAYEYVQKWFSVEAGGKLVGFVNVDRATFNKVKDMDVKYDFYVGGDYFLLHLNDGLLALYNVPKAKIAQRILKTPKLYLSDDKKVFVVFSPRGNTIDVFKYLKGKFRRTHRIKNILGKGEKLQYISVYKNFIVVELINGKNSTYKVYSIASRKPKYVTCKYFPIVSGNFILCSVDNGYCLYNRNLRKIRTFNKGARVCMEKGFLIVNKKEAYDLSTKNKPKLLLKSSGRLALSHMYRENLLYELTDTGNLTVYQKKNGRLVKVATFSIPDEFRQPLEENLGSKFAYLGRGLGLIAKSLRDSILLDENGRKIDRGWIFAFPSKSEKPPVFYEKHQEDGFHFYSTLYKVDKGRPVELVSFPRDNSVEWVSDDRKVIWVNNVAKSTSFLARLLENGSYEQFTEEMKGNLNIFKYKERELYDFDIGSKDVVYDRKGNIIFDGRDYKIMSWEEFDNALREVSSLCFHNGECSKAIDKLYSLLKQAYKYGNFNLPERLMLNSGWLYQIFVKAKRAPEGIRLYSYLYKYVKENEPILKAKDNFYIGYIRPLEEGLCFLYGVRESGKPSVDFSLAYPHCKKACKLGSDSSCKVLRKLREYFISQGQLLEPKPVTTIWLSLPAGLFNTYKVKDVSFTPTSGNPTFAVLNLGTTAELSFFSDKPFSGVLTVTATDSSGRTKIFKIKIRVPSRHVGNTGYIDVDVDRGRAQLRFEQLKDSSSAGDFISFILNRG